MATETARQITAGLLGSPAAVSPKFFYDALGSALFQAITRLDEYYPTRTEAAVMDRHGPAIVARLHSWLRGRFVLVDLGAGDGAKAERLFGSLQPAHYLAIDISEEHLRSSLQMLQRRHPELPMTAMAMDFSRQLQWKAPQGMAASLVFYPGSSIGNFGPDEALRLLVQARHGSGDGALLIGADLVKPAAVLDAAYDDPLGITAAFNLNLLRHVNRLIGSDFDVGDWQHVAFFDAAASRVEMHLQARRELEVRWPLGRRCFAQGERIHTENSYKWTPESFEALLRDAGWRDVQAWTDERRWFGVFAARA